MLLKIIKLTVLMVGGVSANFCVEGESYEAARDKIWADGFIDGFDEDSKKKFRLKENGFWGISEYDAEAQRQPARTGIVIPGRRN